MGERNFGSARTAGVSVFESHDQYFNSSGYHGSHSISFLFWTAIHKHFTIYLQVLVGACKAMCIWPAIEAIIAASPQSPATHSNSLPAAIVL